MIPSLIFLLLRRYQKSHPQKVKIILSKLRFAARIVLILSLSICITLYALSQERKLQYTIKRSGSYAGTMVLYESRKGDRVVYKMESDIKTSFLLTVTAKAVEEAVYEKGILLYSFFYQKINGSEKVNKQIQAAGSRYIIKDKKEVKGLNAYPITYNMVCLYTLEPVNRAQIFSDKFQQFLPIQTIAQHHYKIKFPDGNYNEYYYQNGICTKVRLTNTWYTAEMELAS